MVENTKGVIEKIKFSSVLSNAKKCSYSMNNQLSETNISETIIVENELSQTWN